MKLTDMKKKSSQDLQKHADKLRVKINEKRQAVLTADEKNVREIRKLRKELAQTLTFANRHDDSISTNSDKESK